MENEYIINPYVFYWVHVASVLLFISVVWLVLSGCVFCFNFLRYLDAKDDLQSYEPDDYGYKSHNKRCEYYKKQIKTSFVVMLVFGVLAVFVPNQETAYKMLIANSLTKKNIEVSRDFVIDTIDKAVNKIMNNKESGK